MTAAVRLDDVTVTYADAKHAVLRNVNVHVSTATLAVVIGKTGVGKSTLLGTMYGHVPHFTGGTVSGHIEIGGYSTRNTMPRDLAQVVGFVGQDPLKGFVQTTVEDELVYGMEQLGFSQTVMRARLEETLDLLNIADLRHAKLREISGGQQQRVAIGSVLAAHPQILILDEPTSALDQAGAEDVLSTLVRLVHDLALTIVVAEHRIERVLPYADMVIDVREGGEVGAGSPSEVMASASVAPPVVELGRLLEWTPIPLTVRDARRKLAEVSPNSSLQVIPEGKQDTARKARLDARNITVRYSSCVAVRNVDLLLHDNEIVVLMGRNGSGKTSLMWALQGSAKTASGKVSVFGNGGEVEPRKLDAKTRRRSVGLVPQTASDLLYLDSVEAECQQADRESGVPVGSTRRLLDGLVAQIDGHTHPLDLSEGQKLALVLSIQMAANPDVVLLDEPTRGLDYAAKRSLCTTLKSLVKSKKAVLVSTHDVEFAALIADRIVVMAEGEFVADGKPSEIMTAYPAFAPQVAKIFSPVPILTVQQYTEGVSHGV